MIEVTYDVSFQNICEGRLIIKENGIEIYNKSSCCYDSSKPLLDDGTVIPLASGRLLWKEDEAKNFSKKIREAVREKLSNFK